MARDLLQDQVVQSPIQALNISRDFTHTTALGSLLLVHHNPHSKEFLPEIYSKPTLLKFEATAPCPLPTFPCTKSHSIFLVSVI